MKAARLPRPALPVACLALALASCSGNSSAPPTPTPPCSKELWVATTGSDEAGDGSETIPFRTIDRARRAVRLDPLRGKCTIHVNVRSGTYALAAPLQFEPEDSGASGSEVVYRSAPGSAEPVVISGGIVVEGFDCDAGTGICTAPVPEWPSGQVARQLYVDGERAVRARSNYVPGAAVQPDNPVYSRIDAGYVPLLGANPPVLHHPEWAEVVTRTQWKMMRCPLTGSESVNLTPEARCWANANAYPIPWNFQLLSWIENAPEYLDQPGMWFLDPEALTVQYRPVGPWTPTRAILPRLETLLNVTGRRDAPVSHVRFDGLRFAYATWLGPNVNGYVSDQSGNFLLGPGHVVNGYGHQKTTYPTPGNVNVTYARNITFANDAFEHLGAVGLWLGTGSQHVVVEDCTFRDISSSAIQIGGVDLALDVRADATSITTDNQILNNDVSHTGRDYFDTAGIFQMFAAGTTIAHNSISHTPWSGIAIGWGWGLLDEGGFPGSPFAKWGDWGLFTTPTVARNNRILSNRISNFLEQLWDGGAVYTNGSQGTSMDDGLLLQLNVADHKRPSAGSNVYYTDGGSRYVTLDRNVSFANPVGHIDLGSCDTPSTWPGLASEELLRIFGDNPFTRWVIADLNLNEILGLCGATSPTYTYGAEMGGCVPRGHLRFVDNYLVEPNRFFDICTTNLDVPQSIPDLSISNKTITGEADVPAWIIRQAGRQSTSPTPGPASR